MKVAERMTEANGVELCTESFGRPADPPILLIMGSGASMLWWEDGFCRLLTEGVERADWETIARAILAHTVPGDRGWPPDGANVRD